MREGRHRDDPPSFGEQGENQSYSFFVGGTPSPSHTLLSALPRMRLDMNNLPHHRNRNSRPSPPGILREGAHRAAGELGGPIDAAPAHGNEPLPTVTTQEAAPDAA